MKDSNSIKEFEVLKNRLSEKNKENMRIADFCAYALVKNKNYSLNCRQLMELIVSLGYETSGKTLDRTISTVVRYKNAGLFDKPRNAKFRLKRSVVRKMKRDYLSRKLNKTFKSE